MVSTGTVFVRSEGARLKTVGSSVAVYVPDQRSIHVLNLTAQLLFELLEEPTSVAQLIDVLTQATGAEADRVAADVEAALAEFADKGLVVEASR